jgi:hypothetical protein
MNITPHHPLLDELLKGPWGHDYFLRTALGVVDINYIDYGCELHLISGGLIIVYARRSTLKHHFLLDPNTNCLVLREDVALVTVKKFDDNGRYPSAEKKTNLQFWPGDMDQCYKNFRNMIKYVSGVDPYIF